MAPTINAVQRACEGQFPQVHLLACGHHVTCDTTQKCKSNCKQLAQAMHNQPRTATDNQYFICEHCIQNEWIAKVSPEINPIVEAMTRLRRFTNADVVEQGKMIVDVIVKAGAVEDWRNFVEEAAWKGREQGGIFGHAVVTSDLVDELTAGVGESSIDAASSSVVAALLAGLKI